MRAFLMRLQMMCLRLNKMDVLDEGLTAERDQGESVLA